MLDTVEICGAWSSSAVSGSFTHQPSCPAAHAQHIVGCLKCRPGILSIPQLSHEFLGVISTTNATTPTRSCKMSSYVPNQTRSHKRHPRTVCPWQSVCNPRELTYEAAGSKENTKTCIVNIHTYIHTYVHMVSGHGLLAPNPAPSMVFLPGPLPSGLGPRSS